MNPSELESVARSLVVPGKGILAADESTGSILKRFDSVGVPSTEETRRAYREMLFSTPGIEQYISGAILFDETLHQSTHGGEPFPLLLARRGMLPGIKVDVGAKDLPNFPGEKVTEGLDGLGGRLAEYRSLGARFTKWRAVIAIGAGIPTLTCIDANAEVLARYAALSQEADLVPIVEPEVLMDGDHDIERCEAFTEMTLRVVFGALAHHRVLLEGMLLKANMVIAGRSCSRQATTEAVAKDTMRCLLQTTPAAVPGVVFLSGGQAPVQATANLNAINRLGNAPWRLSFSYGRALQEPSLKAWRGDPANVPEAQRLFLHRARCNAAATLGTYVPDTESSLQPASTAQSR